MTDKEEDKKLIIITGDIRDWSPTIFLNRNKEYTHLHMPEQSIYLEELITLAREIAQDVNKGESYLVTTNAGFFTREITNLIACTHHNIEKNFTKEMRELHGLEESMFLNPNDVSGFKFKEGRMIAEEVRDFGIYWTPIDDCVEKQSHLADDLSYAIFYDEDE